MTLSAAEPRPTPATEAVADDRRAMRCVTALFFAQALLSPQLLIAMTLGPLAGALLAIESGYGAIWATLPISVMVIASTLVSAPASLLQARIGRRAGGLLGVAAGALGGALAAQALVIGSFELFLVAAAFTGVYQAHQNLFRFAAADAASDAFKPKAIGWVLGGGLLAAAIGPPLIAWTRDALDPTPFAGAYIAIVGLNIIGAIPLLLLDAPAPSPAAERAQAPARPLREIFANPVAKIAVFCGMISYALMTLVMTASSTAIVACGFSVDMAGAAIGAHVVAMFGPSFFTGALINRFGHAAIIGVGLAAMAACAVVAMGGVELERFFLALILLGVGWNFGFIGATSLLAAAHRPSERGKVQGLNDFLVFGLVAVGSLSSGQLLNWRGVEPQDVIAGWSLVNLTMIPLLAAAGAAVIWLAIMRPKPV